MEHIGISRLGAVLIAQFIFQIVHLVLIVLIVYNVMDFIL